MFEPTWDSVAQHSVPDWYGGAKLGVFVHWGLYSVPGWAPQVPDIQELLERRGPAAILRENPYAEWYLNTSRLTGSPTWTHQRDTYGPDATYDDFVPVFDDGSAEADMDAIAAVCRDAGARYVILTTKHHDGVDRARVLGLDEPLDWGIDDGVLTVCWPDRLPVAAAHVVAVSGTLRPGR